MGYAIAIAQNQDPARIVFNQALMRHEFNQMLESGVYQQFSHNTTDRSVEYFEHEIDLSDIDLVY